jgi:hypothetical protein
LRRNVRFGESGAADHHHPAGKPMDTGISRHAAVHANVYAAPAACIARIACGRGLQPDADCARFRRRLAVLSLRADAFLLFATDA